MMIAAADIVVCFGNNAAVSSAGHKNSFYTEATARQMLYFVVA